MSAEPAAPASGTLAGLASLTRQAAAAGLQAVRSSTQARDARNKSECDDPGCGPV